MGSVRAATKGELLAPLPPRTIVDLLLQRYFETPDMGSSKNPAFQNWVEWHLTSLRHDSRSYFQPRGEKLVDSVAYIDNPRSAMSFG